jgi:hypothetical protein
MSRHRPTPIAIILGPGLPKDIRSLLIAASAAKMKIVLGPGSSKDINSSLNAVIKVTKMNIGGLGEKSA